MDLAVSLAVPRLVQTCRCRPPSLLDLNPLPAASGSSLQARGGDGGGSRKRCPFFHRGINMEDLEQGHLRRQRVSKR